MLKNTLKGVEENILNLVKNGVSCDDVTVVVIMDGIEKIDPSMVKFFEEMDRENGIHL